MNNYDKIELEVQYLGIKKTSITMEELYKIISSEQTKDKIEQYNYSLVYEGYNYADPITMELPQFCYAGKYHLISRKEIELEYSRLILLHFDNIDDSEIETIKSKAMDCKYSVMVFNGISGHDFNVLVYVSRLKEDHDTSFEKVSEYYNNLLGIKCDTNTRSLEFWNVIGNDVNCLYNRKAEMFEVLIDEEYENDKKVKDDELDEKLIKQLDSTVIWTEKREKFTFGNEKKFIKLFSVNCNNMGYDVNVVVKYSKMNFRSKNYTEVEMEKNIRLVYSLRKIEFCSRQKFTNGVKNETDNIAPAIEELDSKLDEFRSFLISYFDDENKVGFAITYLKGLLK